MNDVELKRALARVEMPDRKGGPREVPVSGRLELEAGVRFPLGALDELKAYTAHGSADVAGATIGGLDLGRLTARLDLADGNLEVADLRGPDGRSARRAAAGPRRPSRRRPRAPCPAAASAARSAPSSSASGASSSRWKASSCRSPS